VGGEHREVGSQEWEIAVWGFLVGRGSKRRIPIEPMADKADR